MLESSHPHVVGPGYRRVDHRGILLEVLNEGRWESLLSGNMVRGAVMGHHYHKVTEVFFFLTAGRAEVGLWEPQAAQSRRVWLGPEQGIRFWPGMSHAIRFTEDSTFLMLKSRHYDPADPDTFACPVPDFG
jgi:quercetin dioxygenase-like cupin family protein